MRRAADLRATSGTLRAMKATEQQTTAPARRHRFTRLVVAVMALASIAGPSTLAAAEELPPFIGDEFADLFNTATLDNLAPIGAAPSITGSSSIDARIRTIGESRGYLRRPLPGGGSVEVAVALDM